MDNFSASVGTYLESHFPIGRVNFLNADGDFAPNYQSTWDYLGISEEQWDNMSPEDRRVMLSQTSEDRIAKHFDADPESGAYLAGNIVGMFADPTTAFPLIGASLSAKMATGAVVGGLDMAAYQVAHEGMPTLGGVALGAGLGAGIVGAIGGAGKLLNKANSKSTNARIRKEQGSELIKQYAERVNYHLGTTDSLVKAQLRAGDDLRLSQTEVRALLDDIAEINAPGKPSQRVRKEEGFVRKFDAAFEPISEHVKAISPKLWKSWVDMERRMMDLNHKFMTRVDGFLSNPKELSLDNLRTKNPDAHRQIKRAMINNKLDETRKLVEQYMGPKGVKALEDYRLATKDGYNLSSQFRSKYGGKKPLGPKLNMYMHRVIKDIDEFREGLSKIKTWKGLSGKQHVSRIDEILNREMKAAEARGRVWTKADRADVFNRYMQGFFDQKKVIKTPGFTHKRKIDEIPDELIDLFHDPLEAMHTYFRELVDDSMRKAFFGKEINDAFGDSLTDSITGFVNRLHEKGQISGKDVDVLKNLLNLRFVSGVKAPATAMQWFKDVGYSSLLGNPISAVVQLGDTVMAMAKYGFRDTMKAMWKAAGEKGLSPEDFGLMDTMMEELVSSGKTKLLGPVNDHVNISTKTLLRRALRNDLPGLNKVPVVKDILHGMSFQNIDKLGKAVHLNASINQMQRLAKSPKGIAKLRAKWGEALGDEFASTVDLLRNPKKLQKLMNETATGKAIRESRELGNIKSMIFADLSDIQPITLLEMPEWYLKHPNGRVFYMLRTFQLKYMNYLRQNFWYQMKAGHKKAALTSGAAMFAAFSVGGASTDAIKNFLLGRDVYPADIITDVLMRNTGVMDRYTMRQVTTNKDPLEPIVNSLTPPYSVYSPFVRAAIQTAKGDFSEMEPNGMMKQLPIFGKIVENYLLGGAEQWNYDRWKEKPENK